MDVLIKTGYSRLGLIFLSAFLFSMTLAPAPARAASAGRQSSSNLTIEKEGFYGGIRDGRVTIIDRRSYRKATYLLSPSVVIEFQGKTVDSSRITIHSVIRLILIDGIVQEMIVIQEAS